MTDTAEGHIHAFIINLERSSDRLLHTQTQLDNAKIHSTRVAAIEGNSLTLPHPQYGERAYRLKHGKHTNLCELGCYLSHLKAYRAFLKTDLTHALICEDDITIPTNTATILSEVIHAQSQWGVVKISSVTSALPINIEPLSPPYSLAINIGRHTGSGAYLISRHAAKQLLKSIHTMTLPFDHAYDKEWLSSFHAYSLQPTLIDQKSTEFQTTIIAPRSFKLPAWSRYWSVFPYRLITELTRVCYRSYRVLFTYLQLRLGRKP